MAAELNVARFRERLSKIHSHFVKHRNTAAWNHATCLSLCRGPLDESNMYAKSVILHQYLFGYELPELILLLNQDGTLHAMGTKKKMQFLKPATVNGNVYLYTRNKHDTSSSSSSTLDDNEGGGGVDADEQLQELAKLVQESGKPPLVGTLLKEQQQQQQSTGTSKGLVGLWENTLTHQGFEFVDCTPGLSFVLAIKDETELDLMKKSSVLSNKLMKHGCIPLLEQIIDESTSISHEALAQKLDDMIEDPSKIGLKLPKDDVASCYFPIVQSGGIYDMKVSAMSDTNALSFDIILISLGARYQNYCSTLSRTFLVDPPRSVSEHYELLTQLHDACQRAMRPGKPLKAVHKAAVDFLLREEKEDLIPHLPKSMGFGMGLDFRDGMLALSAKNPATFKPGMTFALVSSFANLKMPASSSGNIKEEDNSANQIKTYGLQIADMVSIGEQGPDVLTKLHKSLADVSYTIHDEDAEDDVDIEEVDDDDDEEEEEEEDERKKKKTKKKSTNGDAALARRIAKEEESRAAMSSRKSSRLAKHAESAEDIQEGSAIRERKQIELMKRRNEERLQELARGNRKDGQKSDSDQPEELETYRRTKEYPDNIQPNQVKVDMANQCVILPICGNPIPFHISTIKNVVLPDPDSATYLRINFYTAGMAVGKDAPENMAKLVAKYAPYATFIREMTFRSLDSQNLTLAFRQISELRKRARTRELRLQEEANLVEQDKLVRTKNERVPRLSDLTMRPVVAGRKTQGNLEAHSNGLRFISTRAEVVDIMYSNIKYAIFQPCENEIMVLVHFHLKNAIMVGKKRQFDIQFFTEVVDASQTVDAGRRSMYDPDEMDDEQRERQLRKKLNAAFRDFCKKVDAVAKKNNFNLEFDIPYRDLGFIGNPHKEMVMIQPTLNCLVNLTETPFFVVDLADLDHVHFERVTYMSKAFDMVLINKDFTKQPWRIDMIDNGDKDAIQDWLTDMEITYTEGPMNLNWKQIIQTVAADDRFYMNTEEDEVTDKEAGWEFLRLYGHDDDEEDDEEDEDSGYSEAPGEEEEEDDDDDDVEEDFDSEDEDDDDDFDADEELEEQGMDWEDMEKQAILDDRRGRSQETSNDNVRRPDTHDKKRRRENVAPPSSSSRRSAPPPNKHARRR